MIVFFFICGFYSSTAHGVEVYCECRGAYRREVSEYSVGGRRGRKKEVSVAVEEEAAAEEEEDEDDARGVEERAATDKPGLLTQQCSLVRAQLSLSRRQLRFSSDARNRADLVSLVSPVANAARPLSSTFPLYRATLPRTKSTRCVLHSRSRRAETADCHFGPRATVRRCWLRATPVARRPITDRLREIGGGTKKKNVQKRSHGALRKKIT